MTEKEIKLKDELIKIRNKEFSLLTYFESINDQLMDVKEDFDLNVNNIISKFLLKIIEEDKFSYTFNDHQNKHFIYQINEKNQKDLILDINFINLPRNFKDPFPKNINLKIQHYSSINKSTELELEKFKTIGKISEYILKNKSKIIFKAESVYNKYQQKEIKINHKLEKDLPKWHSHWEKFHNFYYPHFKKDIKRGISFSPKSPLPGIDFKEVSIHDIEKVKLIENNTLFIISQDAENPDLKLEYHIKVDNLKDYLCFNFINFLVFNRIKTPKFYPQLIKDLYKVSEID